ncbi:hypothetical protein ADK60_13450 [Streptomyces sp. XY431]|uniref:ATP-grasp domain-containing protein n=1 Tax=Streptomyces sp. XY431 TaxID=1415562 RepID=UPI0006AE190B|nr:hypothetical protein [Streptomyces sp. XY431]KOV32650.1 hypothetical protein ADK60_13450 [Streptomyces sp. XY431]
MIDPKIALVMARPRPEINADHDMPLLLRALSEAGADAISAEWDDPGVDWSEFDLAVIRSTWDYTWRKPEFLDWVDRCSRATRLANPPEVVRWSSDKSYLGTLAAAGVPVVRTRYLAPGDPADLPDDHEYVLKPVIGAGARYAARYRPEQHDEARDQVARMHAEGLTAILQPYMSGIDTTGERALVFVRGRFLHAIRKNAVLSPDVPFDQRKVAHPGLQPWSPTPADLAVAERALATVPGSADLLYARVDLVDNADGTPLVMELELVEPNLFLAAHPDSMSTVVQAITTTAAAAAAQRGTRRHAEDDRAVHERR